MGGASICDQADQGLHRSALAGGLNVDVARQCDWSIVSWLAMTICEGVQVVVEIDGVIANVAGFNKADKRGLTRQMSRVQQGRQTGFDKANKRGSTRQMSGVR